MGERENKRIEKRGVEKMSAELLSRADRILDSVKEKVSKEDYEKINEAFEDMAFALESQHIDLNNSADLENANSLIAEFRKSLPEENQAEIFDLSASDVPKKSPGLGSTEKKRLSEFQREAQDNINTIEGHIEKILGDVTGSITEKQLEELVIMIDEMRKKEEDYLNILNGEYVLDENIWGEIVKKYEEFYDKAYSYSESDPRTKSSLPTIDSDNWSDIAGGDIEGDKGGIEKKEQDLSPEQEEIIDEIITQKAEVQKRLKEIKYGMIATPEQEEKIENASKQFIASLDIYLEEVKKGQAGQTAKKAIDRLIKDFFSNLKAGEKKIKQFSEIKDKDVLGKEIIWVKVNKKKAEEKIEELKDKKVISGDEDYALKVRIRRLFNELDRYLQKVEENKKDQKTVDIYKKEANGKLNDYFIDMVRKMEKLTDKEKDLKKEDDITTSDTLLATPAMSEPRVTMGYGKPIEKDGSPRGVGNGHSLVDASSSKRISETTKSSRVPKANNNQDEEVLESNEMPEGIKLGLATWKNKDVDQPIVVTGYAGKFEGRDFVNIEGSVTGVPVDEIEFGVEPSESTKDEDNASESSDESVERKREKRSPEEQEFLDKIDVAVGQVRQMQEKVKTIQKAYEQDIPHSELLPNYQELFKDKIKTIAGFVGALERFQQFFKERKKMRPSVEEVLMMTDEIENKYNEVEALKTELQDIKKEAEEMYEKKLKSLTEYHDDASGFIDRLDLIMIEPLDLESEDFIDYFSPEFLSKTKNYSRRLMEAREKTLKVESLSESLLENLKKNKKYPHHDEEILLSEFVPQMKEEMEKLEEENAVWKEELSKTRMEAETRYVKGISQLRKSLKEGILPDQEVLDYFYENVCPNSYEFVWPDNEYISKIKEISNTQKGLKDFRSAVQDEMQDKIKKEHERIKEILDYISKLSEPDFEVYPDLDRSPEKISELSKELGEIIRLQESRVEVMPKLFAEVIDLKVEHLKARRVEVEKQLNKFYLSESAQKAVDTLLDDFNKTIESFERKEEEIYNIAVRDTRNELNPKVIESFIAGSNRSYEDLDNSFVSLIGQLEVAEKKLREEKIKKDLEKVEKKKKKKDKKTTKEKNSEESVGEPRSPLLDHLSLREDQEVKKDIERILETEKIIDVTPAEIIRSFSQRDFDELRSLIDHKDQKGFKEFLSGKIAENINIVASPDYQLDLQEAVSLEVYDILKDILDKRVKTAQAKKDSRFLNKTKAGAKVGAKVLVNLGISLGIFNAAESQFGAGSLGLAVGAGATVLFREARDYLMQTAAGEAVSEWGKNLKEKIPFFKKDDRERAIDEEKKYWEDAMDDYVKKENIAVLLSNALREYTTNKWVEEKNILSTSLDISHDQQISEGNYKKCVEALKGVGLEQFFRNSFNYVNNAPDYKALPQEEKILIAETIALTIGQSYRNNLEVAREFSSIKTEAKVKGKSSWVAEKFFKLISLGRGDFLKKHNEKDKGWGRAAGHTWSVLVGGSLMKVIKSSSLEARVLGGAIAGAGAGLSLEQNSRRDAEEKRLQEVDKILAETEKEIIKFESLPIDQLPFSKIKKFSEISVDLQSKIDMGVVRDKSTKSRIDGLVYRVRKMESEKAMEMENDIEALNHLTKLLADNNAKINKVAKKYLDRLRSSTKNKQPAYMLGGAILGAGLTLGLSGDFREWLGEKASAVKNMLGNNEKQGGLSEGVREAKVPPTSYSAGGSPEAYNVKTPEGDVNISPEAPAENIPLDNSSHIEPIENTPEVSEPTVQKPEPVISGEPEKVLSWQEISDNSTLEKISASYPDLKDDFSWLKGEVIDQSLPEKMRDSLKDSLKDLLDEFKLTGKLEVTEKYFETLKKAVEDQKSL